MKKYKVVSLFSGTGGSSLGYKLAGYEVLLANEFIDTAADCYQLNFPNTVVLRDDIRKISGKQILEKLNLQVGELDILDGSPPCAAFSVAGKRDKKWGQVVKYSETEQRVDDLFFEYSRLLSEIKPKVFVAENVKGLVIGKATEVFDKIMKELRDQGYNVSCRVLDAQYLGVPQRRTRTIFVGVRKDLKILPSHPLPTHKPITLREAISDIENDEQELTEATYKESRSVIPILNQMKPGESGDKYANGSYFSLMRLDWDKPSNPVLQSDAKQTSSCCVHPDENRKLTIKELKRVSSFPDDFKLVGNFAQQWERIGRAVPPNMMKEIASHIRYFILDKIYKIEYNNQVFDYYDIDNDEERKIETSEYEYLNRYNPFQEYGKLNSHVQTKLF